MLKGALLGLSLSFLIGPLFFSILQAGLERGAKAGIALASGIWLSDLGYVWLLERSVSFLETLGQSEAFRLWAGLFSAALLAAFGIGTLFFAKATLLGEGRAASQGNLLRYALRGFIINSINPFTVFFWLGIGGSLVSMHAHERLSFFTGMFAVLIAADTLKAWGAKKLKQWLTPTIVVKIQKAIGFLLIVFGIAILVRVLGSPL